MGKTRRTHKNKSMLYKIFIPLLIVIFFQSSIFLLIIFKGGSVDGLHQNAYDIFSQNVVNRANELETKMNVQWTNVYFAVAGINDIYAKAVADNDAGVEGFNRDQEAQKALLAEARPYMLEALRRNGTNGVYLILNQEEEVKEPKEGESVKKIGVNFRDFDQKVDAKDYSDIIVERGPTAVVNEFGYSLDSWWEPYYTFEAGESNDYYFKPLLAAYANPGVSYKDLGYWCEPHRISDKDMEIISYSVPLLDANGKPYGVFGIELSTSFIASSLPSEELGENGGGAYILGGIGSGKTNESSSDGTKDDVQTHSLDTYVYNGFVYKKLIPNNVSIALKSANGNEGLFEVENTVDNVPTVAVVKKLNIYSRNTPFENEEYALVGIMEKGVLLDFAGSVTKSIVASVVISLLLALVGVFVASKSFTKPITQLAKRVRGFKPGQGVKLGTLGINEIDELINSIENLGKNIAENDAAMSTIIKMTGMPLSAFELDLGSGKVFFTETFFDVMGDIFSEDEKTEMHTAKGFIRMMEGIDGYFIGEEDETHKDGVIRILNINGVQKWIKIKKIIKGEKILGIVFDVTEEHNEKAKIEYERDHDQLTGIYNRRAYYSQLRTIFKDPDSLGESAMIMLDIDNLKGINDTYGHEWGDKYIRKMAYAINTLSEKNVLVARISGDEFTIFVYGKKTVDEVNEIVGKLRNILCNTFMELPNRMFKIRASGGIAWYPKDSKDYKELMKYADFAMYEVKRSTKGQLQEFDLERYNKESSKETYFEQLTTLLEEERVDYHLQAIVDIENAKIFAYEALMRPHGPNIKTPVRVLSLAREQGKLYQVEKLTWKKSLEEFDKYKDSMDKDVKIFINSIPNQALSKEDREELYNNHKDVFDRIVLEITEDERIEQTAIKNIEMIVAKGAQVAIDDYGSGYNGQTLLLDINPNYVKIDREIVKNIDMDANRQEVVEGLMTYAASRNIIVIGEGVETLGELKFLKSIGIKYVQGFFLALPQEGGGQLSPKTVELLQKL